MNFQSGEQGGDELVRSRDSKPNQQRRVTGRHLHFTIRLQRLILGFPLDFPINDPGMTTDRAYIDAARPAATRGIVYLEVR